MNRFVIAVALILSASIAAAQDTEEPKPAKKPRVDELIVVTASRTERLVHEVPAAVTVITAADLQNRAADDYGDVFRNVPGVNVTRMSAREMQVTARMATNSLATSQLVLLDGRSIYLDFFGFVMWDFLPVNTGEIKQIEVVRGPGSAVWGANAMTGVINVITKSPRELTGTSIVAGVGEIGTFFSSVMHAGADEDWSYKASAGYYRQDAFERPTGLIPGTQTPYPAFKNEGTEQPKLDLRLDYDIDDRSTFSISGGFAGTDGLVHSGIGPFDIKSGGSMTYAKGNWSRGAFRVSGFANFLDVDSTNLLAIGTNGRPIDFAFKTKTYNADVVDARVAAQRHVLTYGATARHSEFDLSIAPEGGSRDEYGGFVQDEIIAGDFRWLMGARWDHLDPIGSVISPRAALLYSPTPAQTFRISFSRAFRTPSLINSYLDTAILNTVTLPTGRFVFATRAIGNPSLNEERMDAYELGYVGTLSPKSTITMSVYRNKTTGFIDFYPATFYTAAAPPARWPLPAPFLDVAPLRNALPSSFSYRNVGQIINRGAEIALDVRQAGGWSWYANYSYQSDPNVKGIPAEEINVPPSHRANGGVSWDRGAIFANAGLSYQDEAIWRDVLDARYWGSTDSFTTVNAGAGYRLSDRITISGTATNLLNSRIQQHVFGDVIARKVTAQIRVRY